MTDDLEVVPVEDIQVDDNLNYIERPVAILDRKTKELRNKRVELVNVHWQHRKGSEWTWEPEEEMREHYPELFSEQTSRAKSKTSGGEGGHAGAGTHLNSSQTSYFTLGLDELEAQLVE